MSTPVDPRVAYRRRMQRRQTLVIGSVLTVMAVLVVLATGVWTGVLPAIYEPGFSTAAAQDSSEASVCPPEGATTVAVSELTVHVYNGTETAGLAAGIGEILTEAGVSVPTTADWPNGSYSGNILLVTSEAGITNAYTLARAFSGTVVILISTSQDAADTSVSLVAGSQYSSSILSSTEIAALAAGEEITAPAGCLPASSATQAATEAAVS